jgi:hypothetical protein
MPVPPRSRIRSRVRSCRADFAWFTLLLLASFLLLDLFVEYRPRIYDPEYGTRLELLQQRIAEAPEKPLLVFLGSSRVGLAFLPEQMPALHTAEGETPLVFNYSHLGAGPIVNLVQLKRLLRAGILPRWIVVELLPAVLVEESTASPCCNSCSADLPTLLRHVSRWKAGGLYLRTRTNPWYRYRQLLLQEYAPALACPPQLFDEIRLNRQGGDDFWYLPENSPPDVIHSKTCMVLAEDFHRLQQFQISAPAHRAMDELLGLCREKGIKTTIVITPESTQYRALYSEAAQRTLAAYVAELEHTWHVKVVDARSWVPDEAFSDGHHLFRRGGITFTRRLTAEVLQPLVEGQLHSSGRRDLASGSQRSQ